MIRKNLLFLLLVVASLLGTSNVVAQSKYTLKYQKILSKGDTLKAVKKLNGYISKHPELAELYLERARLKIKRGDYDPAMADLNTYCKLNASCGEAGYLKGMVSFKKGNYTEAISELSQYTTKYNEPLAWFYLALSHMWLQHYEVAVNAFKRSIALDDTEPAAYYNAGLSAYYSEQYDVADSLLLEAGRLSPEDSDIILARGLTLLKAGNHVESNKVFRTIAESDRNFPAALYNIGVNYYNLNEFELACDYWSRSIKLGHLQALEAKERHCGKRIKGAQKR